MSPNRGGKLALGQMLRAFPLRSAGFALEGVRLCECWEALDLPADGPDWNDNKVVAYLRSRSKWDGGYWCSFTCTILCGWKCSSGTCGPIAFAMVSHARLGQASVWSGLDSNLIWMILRGRNG